MEITTLKTTDERWLAHCLRVFCGECPTQAQRAYFAAACLNDPRRDQGVVLAALNEDGGIVSGLQLVARRMWLFGGEVPFAGIANVATRADARGRGLASCLMREAVARTEHEGVPLSLLGTALTEFYGQFGYAPLSQGRARAGAPVPCAPTRVERAACGDKALIKLHDKAARRVNGAVARDAAYWSDYLKARCACEWLTAYRDGDREPCAYAALDGDEIIEYACLPGCPDAAEALLLAAPSETPLVPAGYPTRRALTRAAPRDGLMARLNRPLRLANGAYAADTQALVSLLEAENAAFVYSENDSF